MKDPVITGAEASKCFSVFRQCVGFDTMSEECVKRIYKEHTSVVSSDYWADMILMAAEAICDT